MNSAVNLYTRAKDYLETLREGREIEELKIYSESTKKIKIILSYLLEDFYEDVRVEIRPVGGLNVQTFAVNIKFRGKKAKYFFTFYRYPQLCPKTFLIKKADYFSSQYIYGEIDGCSVKLDNGLEDKSLFVVKLLESLYVNQVR